VSSTSLLAKASLRAPKAVVSVLFLAVRFAGPAAADKASKPGRSTLVDEPRGKILLRQRQSGK